MYMYLNSHQNLAFKERIGCHYYFSMKEVWNLIARAGQKIVLYLTHSLLFELWLIHF